MTKHTLLTALAFLWLAGAPALAPAAAQDYPRPWQKPDAEAARIPIPIPKPDSEPGDGDGATETTEVEGPDERGDREDAPSETAQAGPPLPLEKPDRDAAAEEAADAPEAEAPGEDDAADGGDHEPDTDVAVAPPLPLEKPEHEQDVEVEQPGAAPAQEEEEAPAPRVWSQEEIKQARARCRETLAGLAVTYQEVDPIGHSEGCGIAAPIRVSSLGTDHPVEISPPAVLNCTLVAALHKWVEETLQPTALEEFDAPVARVQNASGYACRRRNNKPSGKLSEHALGNAIDVSAFYWADGTSVTVKDGWPSTLGGLLPGAEARFLTALHAGACKVFSTILGPNANASHADHFHFDLGRGGRYLICE